MVQKLVGITENVSICHCTNGAEVYFRAAGVDKLCKCKITGGLVSPPYFLYYVSFQYDKNSLKYVITRSDILQMG